MSQQRIQVSSVTYAIKGRDLLRSLGYQAYIERSKGNLEQHGCGYSIYVNGDRERIVEILNEHHIRVVASRDGDGL